MQSFNWSCPFCGKNSTITGPNFCGRLDRITTNESIFSRIGIRHESIACPNPDCRELSLRVSLLRDASQPGYDFRPGEIIEDWHLRPQSQERPQPEYIPEQIRQDYYEACRIISNSPKAAAALSRRCLQGMIRDFWNIPENKRGNLGAEISFVVENLDPFSKQAIDTIREVGDIGAHMEKDVNYIIDVDHDEARLLIELIEMLFEDWYVQRHEREKRHQETVELARRKRAERKAAKESLKRGAENNDSQ